MSTKHFLAAIGTPIAAVALLAGLQHPALFLWYAAIAWGLLGAGGIASAYTQGSRVVELEKALLEKDRDIADLTAALAEATATLADARVVMPLKPVAGPIKPDLYVVDPPSAPAPVADESWLDDSPLLRDDEGRWRS